MIESSHCFYNLIFEKIKKLSNPEKLTIFSNFLNKKKIKQLFRKIKIRKK